MLKYFVLLVNMLGLLLLGFITGNDINTRIDVPKEVVAGDEFMVTISIDKGDVRSFARIQQNIPNGIIVKEMKSAHAQFSHKNGKLTYIWTKLPSSKKLEVTYTLQVDQRLKGTFEMGGLFNFISDNQRQKAEFETTTITIQPSPFVENSIDINAFQDFLNTHHLQSHKLIAVREHPKPLDNGEYLVNMLIDKGNASKYAKIEEFIPEGFRAEAVKTADGIFTATDQTLKFLWMNLPADQHFIVSYKLIPTNGPVEIGKAINGNFTFVQDNLSKNIAVVQKEFNLDSATEEQIQSYLAQMKSELPTQDLDYQIAQAQSALTASADATGTDVAKNDKEITKEIDDTKEDDLADVTQKEEPAKKTTKADRSNMPDILKAHLLEPESGVYYRVQLAAGHRAVNIRRYFRKYKLKEEVRTESHEGWFKYSIGSFYEYKSARDYRVKIWNTTTIDDAFVSAYNNGKRITVQEALMIADHQWYR